MSRASRLKGTSGGLLIRFSPPGLPGRCRHCRKGAAGMGICSEVEKVGAIAVAIASVDQVKALSWAARLALNDAMIASGDIAVAGLAMNLHTIEVMLDFIDRGAEALNGEIEALAA